MDNTKILEKIQNLLALSENNPSENEAKAALLKAQELMLKYHIENPETIQDDTVVQVFYDLKDIKKDSFVLMLSVIVANNFRCKTAHLGQRVYFFGFDTDAKAAIQCFVFILNFSKTTMTQYLKLNLRETNIVDNWRSGFIVGLYKAFESRAGYELMTIVPQRVLECYNSIQKSGKKAQNDIKPDKLNGAFMDGFRRGKESLGKRELTMRL